MILVQLHAISGVAVISHQVISPGITPFKLRQ
ncbi:Uncharacterised protein [Serratia ficaria]|nr:Uncharacterised protein [Serratia ficaria]